MKTLLIGESQNIRSVFKKLWGKAGHEITECSHASDALKAYQQTLYPLLVLDAHLPDMDGLELCRRIRAFPRGKHCMILFLTALDEPDELQAAFDTGIDEYLVTPLNERSLSIRLLALERGLQRLMERNQALKALKPSLSQIEQAKQEWEATADSLASIVFLLDDTARIVRANRAIEHWELGEVLTVKGRDVHQFLHAECNDAECYLSAFLQQSWEGLVHGLPSQIEAEDTLLHRSVNIQLRPISESPGKKITKAGSFAVLLVRDITTRKETEERLQQIGTELRAVFRSLPDEYFRLNTDGSILDYKTEHDSISSFSKTFLLKWASGLLPDSIGQEFDAAVAQVLKTRQTATVKYWMPVPFKGRRYEEIRVFPFLDDQVLVVVRDMTDWQNAAEEDAF